MDAIVMGNVTLDILCYTVEDVPRFESIAFDRAVIGPGGCGSNVAIGLCMLGVPTALVARIGTDDAYALVEKYWERVGLDIRYIRRDPSSSIAVSVGLIDRQAQPRFVHTPGANAKLSVDDLDLKVLTSEGARLLHIAGYFVLPGLLDTRLVDTLKTAQSYGFITTLDVVNSPRMEIPDLLWPCLPYLDIFLCNAHEAWRLTGQDDPILAARKFRSQGARAVIIKLGDKGCWLDYADKPDRIPSYPVEVVDTTGAGDAFAAGLIAALLKGKDLPSACKDANAAGARIVQRYGAVSGWF